MTYDEWNQNEPEEPEPEEKALLEFVDAQADRELDICKAMGAATDAFFRKLWRINE